MDSGRNSQAERGGRRWQAEDWGRDLILMVVVAVALMALIWFCRTL